MPVAERALDFGELWCAELPFAIVGFGKPGFEQQHLPAIGGAQLAAHLERRATEATPQFAGIVVIARDQQDRHAEVVEQQSDRSVRGGLVMHDVTGDRDRVGGKKMPAGVRKTGFEAWQCGRSAHHTGRVRQQVRVRELNEAYAPMSSCGKHRRFICNFGGSMSNRSISLTDSLYEYLLSVSLREPPLLRQLREETAALPSHSMQIAPEQGQFMALLLHLIGRAALSRGGRLHRLFVARRPHSRCRTTAASSPAT